MKRNIEWRNSIFTRLIITFLLLLLPLYAFGVLVFQWSRDMISAQIYASMQLQSEFLISSLETEVGKIMGLQLEVLADTNLDLLTYASGYLSAYERSQAINRVRERITAIQNTSELIEKVVVYIPSIGLNINSMGDGRGSIDVITPAAEELINDLSLDPNAPIQYWNGRLILKVSSYRRNNQNHPSVLVVELSKSGLSKFMANNYNDMGFKSFVTLKNQNLLFPSDSQDEVATQLFEQLVTIKDEYENEVVAVDYHGNRYLLVIAPSGSTGMTFYQYIPEAVVFSPLSAYKMLFIGFTILALIVIALYSLFTFQLIQKPLLTLVNSFQTLQRGDFSTTTQDAREGINEITSLYKYFDEMVRSLKEMIEQVYNHKILAQRAELKQLQSQINPHFLYNSFFILKKRIYMGDYDSAKQLSEALGEYFQFITRNAPDMVSLDKEVKHARIYAETQAIRFSNRITVDIGALPPEYESVIVPHLILQPLIENSFEHGLEQKEKDGILRIGFVRGESKLIIIIEDNGDTADDEVLASLVKRLDESALPSERFETYENTAIINIHKRLRLTMGKDSGIKILPSLLGGVRVEVHLSIDDECLSNKEVL